MAGRGNDRESLQVAESVQSTVAQAGNAPPEIGNELSILANQIKELNREVLHDCLAAGPNPLFGSRQEPEDALMHKHFG